MFNSCGFSNYGPIKQRLLEECTLKLMFIMELNGLRSIGS